MKLSWPPVSDLTNYQEVSNFDRKLQILNASSELEKKNKPVFAEVASNDNFSNLYAYIRSTLCNEGTESAFEEMSSDEKKVLKLLLINLLKNLEENPGLSEDLEAFQSQPSKIDIAQEEKIKKLKQIVARLAEDGLL